MFSHSLNGVTYSDTSSSSTSSSPNSFPQSPHRGNPLVRPPSQLAMHHAPEVPSTFLPSYYPEGRYASLDQELNGGPSAAGPSTGLFDGSMRSHSPATWEKLSQTGPSTRHLLDGINIADPHPRTSRDANPPTYRITPGSIASSIVPTNRMATSSSAYTVDPSFHSMTSTPQSHGAESSAGGGGGSGGGRYHPYMRERENYGSVSMSSTPSSLSRNTYSNTTMPEPTPSSAAYPGNMYGNVPIPERPEGESWDRSDGELTGEDYARVLEIYSHLMESVPSMRLQHEPIPPGGQRLDNIIDLASEGLSVLTGRSGGAHLAAPESLPTTSLQKRPGANGSGGEKKVTKCLGCGATETPEWRRGPMGPRTLCNACGLVHMKLQRKKKKQEEKAAAAAAAAAEKR